jgi:hypothetical protein
MFNIYMPEDDPLRVENVAIFNKYSKTNVDTVVSILFYFVVLTDSSLLNSMFI